MPKFFLTLFMMVLLSGCTVHFKGKDIEMNAEPVLSSNHTYELKSIDFFARAD